MKSQAKGQQTRTYSVSVDVKRSTTNKTVIYVRGALLRGATATMRRLVANELNRSPALLVLDLSGVIRIDTEGIDAVVSAATQARRIRYLALPRRGARPPCRDRPRRCRTVGAL